MEWVAISFSNSWKWKVKVKSLSLVRLFTTSWTAAYQAPPSMGVSRQEYRSGVPLPSLGQGSSKHMETLWKCRFWFPWSGVEPVTVFLTSSQVILVLLIHRPHFEWCVNLLGLPWQNITDWGLKQQKCIFSQSGSWKLKIKMSAGFGFW